MGLALTRLHSISNFSVGYDHVDLHAAAKRGIRVGHTPNILKEATALAELVLALMLSTARRIAEGDRICRWNEAELKQFSLLEFLGTGLCGQAVGIIGMSSVGLEVAKMAHCGFNARVLYHDRQRVPEDVEQSLGEAEYYSDLYKMLPLSDFVVLLSPPTPETYKMFGRREFSKMKRSANFVNVSHGCLVDHDALVSALEDGTIGAAGLDVSDSEPLPQDHELLTLPNVVLAPHIGTCTSLACLQMLQVVVENIEAVLNNKPMAAEVPLPNQKDF